MESFKDHSSEGPGSGRPEADRRHTRDTFDSTLTVSTELNPYFQCLLEATSKEIKEKYSVVVSDNTVTLVYNILNITFIKH